MISPRVESSHSAQVEFSLNTPPRDRYSVRIIYNPAVERQLHVTSDHGALL